MHHASFRVRISLTSSNQQPNLGSYHVADKWIREVVIRGSDSRSLIFNEKIRFYLGDILQTSLLFSFVSHFIQRLFIAILLDQ